MDTFDRVFTREQDLMIIGTAAHEWVVGRDAGTTAWGMEGVGIEPGEPVGWEQDWVAWAADRPSFVFGDVRIPIRLLAVMVEEDGEYKIVNAHFSVGVPDEVAGEKAVEWSKATPAHWIRATRRAAARPRLLSARVQRGGTRSNQRANRFPRLNERTRDTRVPADRDEEEEMSEQGKAALRTAVERFNAGDEAYFDFYTDDTTVYGLPGAPVLDREGLIAFYRGFWAAFPKAKVEVLQLLAEGDLLAARFRISGALENEFMGVQPDGKSISVEALNLFRMTADGRCAERWIRMDEMTFMSQLGLMPSPATA